MKQTALHDAHVALGAKMVDFGGWSMPVQYIGILKEHRSVREAAGLFDISHMGQLMVEGPASTAFLNRMLTNDAARLPPGKGHYSFLLNHDGGIIDDLFVYRLTENAFLLVVNASKHDEDVDWLRKHNDEGAAITDRGDGHSAIALQGPAAPAILEKSPGMPPPPAARNAIVQSPDDDILVASTGYTGEAGFEILMPSGQAVACWQALLEAGAPDGIVPCGLGARDTLRLEMGYPLNGADLSPDHSPIEAGMAWAVKLSKPDFIGRNRLAREQSDGTPRKLCAFRIEGKSPPPRPHCPVWINGKPVSETTSATLSPSLGTGIGMAYIPTACANPGTQIEIEIRNRKFPALIERKPLYKNKP